jgi:hypothetical protein
MKIYQSNVSKLVESLTPAQVLALGGVLSEHPELLSSALMEKYTAMGMEAQIEAHQQMNRLFCDRIE